MSESTGGVDPPPLERLPDIGLEVFLDGLQGVFNGASAASVGADTAYTNATSLPWIDEAATSTRSETQSLSASDGCRVPPTPAATATLVPQRCFGEAELQRVLQLWSRPPVFTSFWLLARMVGYGGGNPTAAAAAVERHCGWPPDRTLMSRLHEFSKFTKERLVDVACMLNIAFRASWNKVEVLDAVVRVLDGSDRGTIGQLERSAARWIMRNEARVRRLTDATYRAARKGSEDCFIAPPFDAIRWLLPHPQSGEAPEGWTAASLRSSNFVVQHGELVRTMEGRAGAERESVPRPGRRHRAEETLSDRSQRPRIAMTPVSEAAPRPHLDGEEPDATAMRQPPGAGPEMLRAFRAASLFSFGRQEPCLHTAEVLDRTVTRGVPVALEVRLRWPLDSLLPRATFYERAILLRCFRVDGPMAASWACGFPSAGTVRVSSAKGASEAAERVSVEASAAHVNLYEPLLRAGKTAMSATPTHAAVDVLLEFDVNSHADRSAWDANALYAWVVQSAYVCSPQKELAKILARKRPPFEEARTRLCAAIHGNDDDIGVQSSRVSLLCPLSQTRIQVPVRVRGTTQLQCFDARSYIELCLLSRKFVCPVTGRPAPLSSLQVCEFFRRALQVAAADEHFIDVLPDGSMRHVRPYDAHGFSDATASADNSQSRCGVPVPKKDTLLTENSYTGSPGTGCVEVIDLSLDDD
ncbi:hypothetical protein CDCA_CDCA14G3854 [Cyanidium caldarium]|uniref:SP-RING-type domain-containing protein n=1 Tax=Cyanidium caldarium TaxID=2771 RepID=A0AAV9J0H3_CYACA|nr:hypothetical protein CDCA_CDCA14G3854 [Cyanidium caldarium]